MTPDSHTRSSSPSAINVRNRGHTRGDGQRGYDENRSPVEGPFARGGVTMSHPSRELRQSLEYELRRFTVEELVELVLRLFDDLVNRIVRAEGGGQ